MYSIPTRLINCSRYTYQPPLFFSCKAEVPKLILSNAHFENQRYCSAHKGMLSPTLGKTGLESRLPFVRNDLAT